MASGLQVCRVLPVMRKSVPPPAQDKGTHSATRRCVQGCHADTLPPEVFPATAAPGHLGAGRQP